jgi:hypothetical protein
MLSKQDKLLMVLPRFVKKVLVKKVIEKMENNVCQGGGEKKYTHFEIGGHVQMTKSDPRHKGSPRYRIANGWKNEFGS